MIKGNKNFKLNAEISKDTLIEFCELNLPKVEAV